jgi:hypothetical protein
MKTNQVKTDANQDMLAEVKTNQAGMLARMEVKTDINLKEIKESVNQPQGNERQNKNQPSQGRCDSKGSGRRIDGKAGSQDQS